MSITDHSSTTQQHFRNHVSAITFPQQHFRNVGRDPVTFLQVTQSGDAILLLVNQHPHKLHTPHKKVLFTDLNRGF
jgi:hypothetical protein